MTSVRDRTHRREDQACTLPGRGDVIQVLWVLDNIPKSPREWCSAEVLHIKESHKNEGEVLGTGYICYPSTEHWLEEVNKVEFLGGFLLRCVSDDDRPGDENVEESLSENPSLSWRFTSQPIMASSGTSSGDEWIPTQKDKRGRSDAPTALMKEESNVEVKRLRIGHAALSVHIHTLTNKLEDYMRRTRYLENSMSGMDACNSVTCVIGRLRRKLALKMQQSVRSNGASYGASDGGITVESRQFDGVLQSCVKVRVECTLSQFELIARQVESAKKSEYALKFFPDYCETQLPALSSSMFTIVFASFMDLCDHLQISSMSDRLYMMRKCGNVSNAEVLRIAGSYIIDGDLPGSPSAMLIGTSCSSNQVRAVLQQAQREESEGICAALYRRNGEWCKEDSRFTHRLQLKHVDIPHLSGAPADGDCLFSLTWRRSSELTAKNWSKLLCDTHQIFGTLEASLPFFQTTGKVLCTEVGGLAVDSIDNLLKTK